LGLTNCSKETALHERKETALGSTNCIKERELGLIKCSKERELGLTKCSKEKDS